MPVRAGTYLVVHFLKPCNAGDGFAADAWPLHITLLPPFSVTGPVDEDALGSVLRRHAPMEVRIHEPTLFGARHDIPVNLVEEDEDLQALHEALYDFFTEAGASFRESKHVREGYRPHVTSQKTGTVTAGDRVVIDSAAIVDRAPGGDQGQRLVVDVHPLGEAG